MDKHIFVSFKHEDGDFAEVLINRLEKAGFNTWVDHDKLQVGEDWRAEIDQAINSAFALVVIMTPEAKTSEYVTYEWSFAWGAGVKVIPIVLKYTPLHPRLEALQYIDFSTRINRPWEKLIEVVRNAVTVQAPAKAQTVESIPLYIKDAVPMLDSSKRSDRLSAIEILAQSNHPAARKALVDALDHSLREVRSYAALALSDYPQAVPGLIEALNDKDSSTRTGAAEALGKLKDKKAVAPLIETMFNDLDNDVKETAANALRRFDSSEATEALQKYDYDNDPLRDLDEHPF